MAYWPLNTGLTNVRVIQENEGSQRAKYLSHDKLISPCFYLFFCQKKNVEDHLTPYTVRAVSPVWYVFSKWPFNRGEDNKKNSSLGPQKRWPRPRPLNRGVRSMQVSFTVIKGNDFRDFVKWPLNRGPLNTGVTVLSMVIFCFCLQYSILGVALSNRYCQFS